MGKSHVSFSLPAGRAEKNGWQALARVWLSIPQPVSMIRNRPRRGLRASAGDGDGAAGVFVGVDGVGDNAGDGGNDLFAMIG